jgi:hypothetical protein
VAGVALFADLTNQLGMGGRNKGAMHYLLAAQHAGNTEGSRVNALFNYSSSHPNRGRRNGAVAQEIQKGGLSFSEGSMWAGANTAQPQYADPQPQRNQGNG